MRLRTFFVPAISLTGLILLLLPCVVSSQEPVRGASVNNAEALPEAPEAMIQAGSLPVSEAKQRPKGILGMMSSDRIVNAGETPPPPTPRLAFKIATHGSFDPSSFALTGVTSLMAEGLDTNPQLGKGAAGFGRYYWRGHLNKTIGNYLVLYALPTVFHQDERYYIKGNGGIVHRSIYASSRVLITPDYRGHKVFNTSEVLGRGIAEGISLSYNPDDDRTVGSFAGRYAYSLGCDALTNLFREFWPDVATRLRHRHQ
jgi:hypothetical protein